MILSISDATQDLIMAGRPLAMERADEALNMMMGPGPGGALGRHPMGAAVAQTIHQVAEGVWSHGAPPRQMMRAGAALAHLIASLEHGLEAGRPLREDGFFSLERARPPAGEVLEGVLLLCAGEHEEGKIRPMARLFTSAAFDPGVSPATVNHLIGVLRRLTYRQLCLLQLFSAPPPVPLRASAYPEGGRGDIQTDIVLTEIYRLYEEGLAHCLEPGARAYDSPLGIEEIHPAWMLRSSTADLLHQLLGLDRLPMEDIRRSAEGICK